ncbi:PilZ domain-containing protein [Kaarinaea lacus]
MSSNNEPKATDIVDKRKHQRLQIAVAARISVGDSTRYEGTTKNISFSGAYINCNQGKIPEIGTSCIVTLTLQEGDEPVTIKFKARVKHQKISSVGLEFQAIFAEDYNDFVYLMVNNSPDPDGLLEEISRHPGIKIHT